MNMLLKINSHRVRDKERTHTFRHALDVCKGTAKGTIELLPWELGSGSVSLATKCITVVRPGGNFRAIQETIQYLLVIYNL